MEEHKRYAVWKTVVRVENLAAHQLNSTSAGKGHFTKVLNVRSQFDGAEMTEVRQRD